MILHNFQMDDREIRERGPGKRWPINQEESKICAREWRNVGKKRVNCSIF
jgi:hypothetical protein